MHAAVFVIGNDVDLQMEPFDENLIVPEYTYPVEEGDLDNFLNFYQPDTDLSNLTWSHKLEAVEFIYRRKGLDWNGDTWEFNLDNSTVVCHSTWNPNGRWDWYEIGGRWSDSLITLDKNTQDNCFIKNLDFSLTFKEENLHGGPSHLLVNGEWFDSGNFPDTECIGEYQDLMSIADTWVDFVIAVLKSNLDQELTVVDIHF